MDQLNNVTSRQDTCNYSNNSSTRSLVNQPQGYPAFHAPPFGGGVGGGAAPPSYYLMNSYANKQNIIIIKVKKTSLFTFISQLIVHLYTNKTIPENCET